MTLSANADILIVDDTPANLNVLSAILGKRGYRVRPAINGALALKAAQKAAPDLILLDLDLPAAQGLLFLQQVRQACQTTIGGIAGNTGVDDITVW